MIKMFVCAYLFVFFFSWAAFHRRGLVDTVSIETSPIRSKATWPKENVTLAGHTREPTGRAKVWVTASQV